MKTDIERDQQKHQDESQAGAAPKQAYAKPELSRLGLLRRLTRFSF